MIENIYDGSDIQSFVDDIVIEAGLIAPVVDVLVSGNETEHLKGNIYLVFQTEKDAEQVKQNFNGRWYNGRPVFCDLSPVVDLRTACCRQGDSCDRGQQCNYVHAARIPRDTLESLWASQELTWR